MQTKLAARNAAFRLVLLCLALGLSILQATTTLAMAQQDDRQLDARIEGTVRDSVGKPLTGVAVVLQAEDESRSAKTTTNAHGAFAFPPVGAGTYNVVAKKSGFRDATVSKLSLARGEKKHCDLTLRAADESSPVESSAPSRNSSTASNKSSAMQLDDTPHFTVAGVTDTTGSGGHGSETRARTGEALAKETVKLESGEANADLDEKLGSPVAAVREYKRAADPNPTESNYFAWGAELLLHRAAVPATEVFERGVRLHPDSARMLAGLGAALYTAGSTEEAAQRLCAASDLAPLELAPYRFLGEMQQASSTPIPCVEQKLARFAREQPESALANYYYALALSKRGRVSQDSEVLQQTETLLKKAVAIDPTLGLASLQLGNLYFARGVFDEALAAYQKAVAADPASSEAHYQLGLTYKRLGQVEKAQIEFEQYRKLESAESAAADKQRRELQQFIVVLKDKPANDQDSTKESLPRQTPKN